MKTKITLILAAVLSAGFLSAQVTLGTLKGQIVDGDKVSIPSAKVFLEGQGVVNRQKADLEGKFTFEALKPGVYNLKAVSMGKDTTTINTVEIKPDAITNLEMITLQDNSIMKDPIVIEYRAPLIKKDISNTSHQIINYLSLLFVPIGVGVVMHINYLGDNLFKILAIIILGTLTTLVFTAFVMEKIINLEKKNVKRR